MKSVYELKWFKNSRHPDIIDALKLYVDYTEPALRTDTKEILHCIDNWNTLFDDKFYVLGLYLNRELIGFAELAYFEQEKFIIVDYLVIHKNYRKNNTFYQFVDDITRFLSNENLEYNYIVAEVACYDESLEPPESSKLLIKLLKMSHFGVVKCNYYVPRVGIYDFESAMRSVMMIYTKNESKQIKRETFFQIVEAIYYKYYQRWHNMFVDEEEQKKYDQEIKDLILRMEKQLDKKKVIEINGLNSLFPVKTNFDNGIKTKRVLKALTAIVLFIMCFILVGLFYTFLKIKLGWDSGTVNTIITGSIGLTLFLVALIFENRSNLFSKIFEKVLDKF